MYKKKLKNKFPFKIRFNAFFTFESAHYEIQFYFA